MTSRIFSLNKINISRKHLYNRTCFLIIIKELIFNLLIKVVAFGRIEIASCKKRMMVVTKITRNHETTNSNSGDSLKKRSSRHELELYRKLVKHQTSPKQKLQ